MSHLSPPGLNCSHRQSPFTMEAESILWGLSFQKQAVKFLGGSWLLRSPLYTATVETAPVCCWEMVRGMGRGEKRSHQITETSAVFLPLRTITIETTSCCYHGNHAVPATSQAMMQRPLRKAACKALVLSVLRSPRHGARK